MSIQDKYVIVLDVQPQYYSGTKLDNPAGEMVRNINSILEVADPGKIIYINSIGKALSVSFKGIRAETVPPTPFDSRLKRIGNTIFTKESGDAFDVKELTDYLSKVKAKEVIILGLLAERCVTNTALGARKRGFDVFLLPEAILGKNPGSKEKAIGKMKKEGAQVLTMREIID
jgi:nicotinamidase-related amidase